MIGEFLQTIGFFGGGIGDLLNNLAQAGFFSYVIPFLLIFALVFGILTQIKLFKDNKGVRAIISLAVGLMALTQPLVPQFFSSIFPNLGVGISILLVFLILIGLFVDPKHQQWIMYGLFFIAVIIAIVVVAQSSGSSGESAWLWIQNNLGPSAGTIIILVIVVIAVAAIIGVNRNKNRDKTYEPWIVRESGSS